MKYTSRFALFVVLLAAVWASLAGFKGTGSWQVPSKPTIAILPMLNQSGEKWAELKQRQIDKGNTYLRDQFEKRGFDVIPQEKVLNAISTLNIDLTDEEQQKRETLIRVADAVNADYVFFGDITDTSQRLIQQILGAKREGTAKVKMWLLNPKGAKPILLTALTVEGKSGGGFIIIGDKGSDRQVQAVENALRDGLADFFKDFPEIKPAKK